MKRRRKIKIIPIIILLIIIVLGIFGVNNIVKTINYHKTYEYKLIKVGYTKDEVKELEKLSDETIDYILEIEYNKNILYLLKEKYFMEKNFKDYLDYLESSNKDFKDVVSIVNVGSNNKWYTNTKKTDLSKGNLILTNKFYSLDDSYNSSDMVKVSSTYSFGYNQMLTKDTFNAFLDMWKDAKKEGLTLIINSSYRSYNEQEEVYNEYKEERGEEAADKIAARPGFSEHQTGMAIDIQTYGSTGKTFESFNEFKWLKENAHKYGFILRYPKGKEYLTGYDYESWHFRYVGVEAATYIYENDITFDEYYAYFVEKD
jgi:LAS superfamily LD-carboxypeptidase LdcB